MKKIILSTVAITTLAMTGVSANTSTDIAEMKAMMKQMNQRLAKLETENKQLKSKVAQKEKTAKKKTYAASTPVEKQEKVDTLVETYEKATPVFAKTSKIKFSGQHYLGFVSQKDSGESYDNKFEMRRNYLQTKAYLFDDPKSYMRVTLDAYQNTFDDGKDEGSWEVRVKYAYLYLNDVLPFTGVEFGIAHRPWLDYEEHQGWWHRAVDKTFTESKQSADLTNSADLGVNFKTKTPYFTSELGIFNGEGYHGIEGGKGLSGEWRLTAAILGNGEEKRKARKTTYFDASFWGQYNVHNSKNDEETYKIYGFHAVYNQPEFLISAQYNIADNDNDYITNSLNHRMHHNGHGYSVNGDYRFGEELQYDLFARYDHWKAEDPANIIPDANMDHVIYGIAWEQNKNVTWYLNGKYYDPEDGINYEGKARKKFNAGMLTAEINW